MLYTHCHVHPHLPSPHVPTSVLTGVQSHTESALNMTAYHRGNHWQFVCATLDQGMFWCVLVYCMCIMATCMLHGDLHVTR